MNYNKQIVVLLLMFLNVFVLSAQTFKEKTNVFTTNRVEDYLLSNQQETQKNQPETYHYNKVFISQVGQDNTSNVIVSSNNSALTINQSGNENFSYINLTASDLRLGLTQIGNNHRLNLENNYSTKSINSNVKQTGSNQSLEIYGANSLLENMKIIMKGNQQSIIVRNF